jgi:Leucine-rich repeat (LRR) protein
MRLLFSSCFLIFFAASLFPSLSAQINLISPTQLQQEPVYFQLEKALENPEKVFKLYVDDLNTDPLEFWAALPKFRNLQMLTMEGDFFEILPDTFLQLRNRLTILIIKDNAIAQWEKCFTTLSKFRFLRSLSLENCQFDEQILPDNIQLLQQVRELSLADSPLKAVPKTIGKLRRLETLDLSSCQLSELPDEIGQLRQLMTLYLGISSDGFPNQFQSLPKTFFKLKDLQILHLSQNPLKQLPANFERLQNLHTLNLTACATLNPTATLKTLCLMPQLIDLSLSDIPMRSLPSDIKNWQELERLDISHCGLAFLSPNVFKLTNLKTINVRGNDFPQESIDELLKKIPNVNN